MTARIRPARESDGTAVAAIYRPSVDGSVISFEIDAPSAAVMARRIVETSRAYPWLVCEVDGHVAGYAYASRHAERAAYRWTVNVSVYVEAAFHRRGIGRALYRSLFAILAAQGYRLACAGITLPNAASVGLHESLGFTPVGVYRAVGYKLGAWRDVGWWQLALARDDGRPPSEPIEMAAVEARPDWPALLACGETSLRAE
jgi:phosphinothricin acetyltransferase